MKEKIKAIAKTFKKGNLVISKKDKDNFIILSDITLNYRHREYIFHVFRLNDLTLQSYGICEANSYLFEDVIIL